MIFELKYHCFICNIHSDQALLSRSLESPAVYHHPMNIPFRVLIYM